MQSMAASELVCHIANGVLYMTYSSLHPVLPLLATTSGQWTFPITPDSEDEDHSEQKEEQFENTLKIWSLQGQRTGPYSTIINEH